MEWYVYRYDPDTQKIVEKNIFEYGRFKKELDEMYKKYKTKEEFSKKLDSVMCCYLWGWRRMENDVFIVPFVDNTRRKRIRIDAYKQLHMNWDAFVDYVWKFKED